jgi:hypothetical protein
VAKKRTRWPGQHLDCGICDLPCRYGAHGQVDHLLCAGASQYSCWNATSVDGPLAAEKLLVAILGEISALPDYDAVLTEMMQEEVERARSGQATRRGQLEQDGGTVDRQLANIRASLRQAGPSAVLIEELKDLERRRELVRGEIAALERVPGQVIAIPPLEEIKSRALEALTSLARTSPEFGRLMRRLTPRIRVHPHRLCNGGHVVHRARFMLDLVALIPEARGLEGCSGLLRRELEVDLFDPPQREKYRRRVLALRAEGLTERQVAARLGITQPAVQAAAALARAMEKGGLTDPYVPVLAPPEDNAKLRRHRHSRYRFERHEGTTRD